MYRTLAMCLVGVGGWLLTALAVAADSPSADYIFPAGGQRGTTVSFRVGAHFLHGGSPFEMLGPGVEASPRIERTKTTWFEGPLIVKPASQGAEVYPKDHLGQVKIAADAALGSRPWRLWTSQGAVGGRFFVIGDLPEIVEEEIDGRPIPTRVDLPVTINGRIFPREDVDIWEFHAQAGQSVTCAVVASRIGSPLDSRLLVYDPQGRLLTENTDYYGTDSLLRFQAPVEGTYRLHIHDVNYRGLQPYIYRLTVTAGPFVDHVYPLGGRMGTAVDFELVGQRTPDGPVRVMLPGPGSVQTEVPHSQHFPLPEYASNPLQIDLSSLPEHLESEPNDAQPSGHEVIVPAVLNGRVDRPGDVDRWLVKAVEGEELVVDLWTARFGSPMDAVLKIHDVGGKELLVTGSSPQSPSEVNTRFKFPSSGQFVVEIRDVDAQRGGPEFAYRLKFSRPPEPDFRLRLPSDVLSVFRGAEVKFKVPVQRIAGFKEAIELVFEGLPTGVGVAPTTIPEGKNEVEIILKADAKTKIRDYRLSLTGTATRDGKAVTRRARMAPTPGVYKPEKVLLMVCMPTPFKIDGEAFQTNYAARGTVHRRHYRLHLGGYQGPLEISLADRQIRHQQGVTGPVMPLAPGTTEFDYSINIPTWLEMNRTGRMVVMAVGEVEDEEGGKHKVSYSSGAVNDQIIILTAPCPLNIKASRQSVRVVPGEALKLGVTISRGVLKPAPVKVEVLPAAHIRGVTAEPLTLATEQTTGDLQLRFGNPLGPFNLPLVIRATMIHNGDPVIAETNVDFVLGVAP